MLYWKVDTFLDVCETLNFTRTAERLSITQPAVSQHIAWLEHALGAALIERHGRTLSLTPAGALARDMLRAHRNDEAALRREIATLGTAQRTLRIGATLTVGEYLLARPLARWCARSPHTEVHVAAADTAQLLAQLDEGAIECALVEGIFDATRYETRTWSVEHMVCVEAAQAPKTATADAATRAHAPKPTLSAGSPAQPNQPRSFFDLLGRTLIVREEGSGSRAVLERALAHENLTTHSFARVVEAAGVNVSCEMAAAGLGITFVYEPAARGRIARGELRRIPLEVQGMSHPIAFVWQKGSLLTARYANLFRELHALASEHDAPGGR